MPLLDALVSPLKFAFPLATVPFAGGGTVDPLVLAPFAAGGTVDVDPLVATR